MIRQRATGILRAALIGVSALLLPACAFASQTTVTIVGVASGGLDQQAGNGNWDSGTLRLTVDGVTETAAFGKFSSVNSVASALAAKFSLDCHSPFKAHAHGAVITFVSKRTDVSFQQITAAAAWDHADFAQSSFNIAQAATVPTAPKTPALYLSCTPNPVPLGGSTACTARISVGEGNPVPTGSVTFTVDGQPAFSTTNVDGDGWAPASVLSGLATGSHTLLASYSGDSNYIQTSNSQAVTMNTGSLASTQVYSYTITPSGGPSGYAANGNLLSYTDSVNGTWNMIDSHNNVGYDNLDRLTAAKYIPVSGATVYWCWNYDSFGNRLTETTSSQPLAAAADCPTTGSPTVLASSHQYNEFNQIKLDPAIQYDPSGAGYTIADHDNSYLYDGEGHVCAVRNGLGLMTQYIYDADGTRVAKGSISSWSCDTSSNGFQASSSYVLGSGGEQVTEMNVSAGQSTWAHTNVYAGGMLVATYDPLGLHFHLTDWLGNRRVQTNAFGQIEETCVNSPYGNGLNCSSPAGAPTSADDATEHHFTGKERDAESGLDYFDARYYGSSMGRFTSPDTFNIITRARDQEHLDLYLGQPQNWNMYAYTWNNPLRYTDPTGETVYVVTYTKGNEDGDADFKKAADTRANEIRNSKGFNSSTDTVLEAAVSSIKDFANVINQANGMEKQFGKVGEVDLFSHSGDASGPNFNYGHNRQGGPHYSNEMNIGALLSLHINWASNAQAGFYGCNTAASYAGAANFAQQFANVQRVPTFGFTTVSNFSHSPNSISLRDYFYIGDKEYMVHHGSGDPAVRRDPK